MPRVLTVAVSATGAWLAGRWLSRSDASAEECWRVLPGDDLVSAPPVVVTRAIEIGAPPEAVWPWLVQIGQGRAGFYSHAWLENLLGCAITNADRIEPEWQQLAPGDEVAMHPSAPPLVVRAVAPPRHLVLGEPEVFSWAFVLEPTGAGTRLVVRSRGSFGLPAVLAPLLQPAHGVMERSMLRGLRARAERTRTAA
ncbi:MAG: SRPBCC family protein [Gaiella sp.]